MHGEGWFNTLLLYHIQYEKGFLPEPGGINDQPGKFPELMTTLSYVLNVVSEEKRKQEAKEKPISAAPRTPKNGRFARRRQQEAKG